MTVRPLDRPALTTEALLAVASLRPLARDVRLEIRRIAGNDGFLECLHVAAMKRSYDKAFSTCFIL